MNNKPTIDGVQRELRELLERVIDAYAAHDNNPHCHLNCDQEAIDELRALLDAPVVESELDRMTRRCQNAELALKVQTENYEALKAAKHQDEPVAWMSVSSEGTVFYSEEPSPLLQGWEEIIRISPLYAEQPAPLAMVLPERELYMQYLAGVVPNNAAEVNAYKDGWNACLDEIAILNRLK
jgi:hypothetical protein